MDFWATKITRKIHLRQVEQGFPSFFAKYLPHFTIFQCFTEFSEYSPFENHQICPKNGRKWRKSLFSTCLKPTFPWHFQNPKPGFRVTDPFVIVYICKVLLRKFYLSEPKKVDNRSQTQKAFVRIGNYLLGGSKKVINHGFRKKRKTIFAFF